MAVATRHTLTSTDDPIQYCYDRGWTDGLPVVPPTEDRVAARGGSFSRRWAWVSSWRRRSVA